MSNYSVSLIDKHVAKEIILKKHILKKWSPSTHCFGLFKDEKIVGVVVYGQTTGRQTTTSISPTLTQGQVIEFKRFWADENTPNSAVKFFMDETYQYLVKNTKAKVIVGYASPDNKDCGQFFKLNNWLYQGNSTMKAPADRLWINNELLNSRNATRRYGSIKPEELIKVDPHYQRIYTMKKHRYIYILRPNTVNTIISTLKHPIKQYPTVSTNCEW